MFVHIFLFRWKPEASAADRAAAARAIRDFQNVVPGLSSVIVGDNLSVNGGEFTFGGVMHFVDAASYHTYVKHPAHEALLAWLALLIDAVECDIATSSRHYAPTFRSAAMTYERATEGGESSRSAERLVLGPR